MVDKNSSKAPSTIISDEKIMHTRQGNATIIEGIGILDSPEIGGGNLLAWASFPAGAKLVWYPGCISVSFEAGAIVIDFDNGLKARPKSAAITIEENNILFHPPADQPELRAIARVCEFYNIDFDLADAPVRLAVALARKFHKEAFLPAGRDLKPDERSMSIAWVVDQERKEEESIDSAISRARSKLVEYQLIDEAMGSSNLKKLFKIGQNFLQKQGLTPWNKRKAGRPRKMGTPVME